MSLILRNKTRCSICNKLILEGERIRSIPDFSYGLDSPYDFFSGKIFHEVCFISHAQSNNVLEHLDKIEEEYDKKVCFISGEPITIDNIKHPDNHIFVGYLTKDKGNPLFKYNNIHLNKRYLEFWKEKDSFKKLLLKSVSKLNTNEKHLQSLLYELDSPIHPALKKEILERYKNYTKK